MHPACCTALKDSSGRDLLAARRRTPRRSCRRLQSGTDQPRPTDLAPKSRRCETHRHGSGACVLIGRRLLIIELHGGHERHGIRRRCPDAPMHRIRLPRGDLPQRGAARPSTQRRHPSCWSSHPAARSALYEGRVELEHAPSSPASALCARLTFAGGPGVLTDSSCREFELQAPKRSRSSSASAAGGVHIAPGTRCEAAASCKARIVRCAVSESDGALTAPAALTTARRSALMAPPSARSRPTCSHRSNGQTMRRSAHVDANETARLCALLLAPGARLEASAL